MKRMLTRVAVAQAATLVFGGLGLLTAPPALADCYLGGAPFQGVTAGAHISADERRVWSTSAVGTTTITLTSTDPNMSMYVNGTSCQVFCGWTTQCTFNHTGIVHVTVSNGTGAYVLTTAVGGVPQADDCNLVDLAGVCVGLVPESIVESVTVREPALGSAEGHPVVGRIEQWRVPLPAGASIVLPCVVLAADGLGTPACSLIPGASYVSTVAVLVDDEVAPPSVGFGDPLLTVGVCGARLTATVLGFGVEGVPAVSLC